jgi:hypothetical protein
MAYTGNVCWKTLRGADWFNGVTASQGKQQMKQALRGLGVMMLASLFTVAGSTALSFGILSFQSLSGVALFSIGLTALAWVVYNIIGFCTTKFLIKGTSNPGALLITALLVSGYGIALPLLGSLFPTVVVVSFSSAVAYALATTVVFWVMWALGAISGVLPRVKSFMPERR